MSSDHSAYPKQPNPSRTYAWYGRHSRDVLETLFNDVGSRAPSSSAKQSSTADVQPWLLAQLHDTGGRYQGLPLNPERHDVRLLHLHPGSLEDEIRCDLSVVSLDINEGRDLGNLFGEGVPLETEYEALSYTWGAFSDRTVTLNGASGFLITNNLFSCLHRLRYHDRTRTLWIDAICIDQGNLDERSSQVSMMGRIYNLAKRVVVWLGDVSIERSDRDSHVFFEGSNGLHHGRITFDLWQAKLMIMALEKTEPPWWTRAWVLQESALSQEPPAVCFGDCELGFEAARRLAFLIETPKGKALHEFFNSVRNTPIKQSLIHYAGFSATLTCKDARDKVYSMLSFIAAGEAEIMRVDYKAPTWSVFADATYATVAASGNLDVLAYLSCHDRRPSDLPSWTVDWTFPEVDGSEHGPKIPALPENMWRGHVADALRPMHGKAKTQLDDDSRTLTLTGSFVGRIRDVVALERDWSKPLGGQKPPDWDKIASMLRQLPKNSPYHIISTQPHDSATGGLVVDWKPLLDHVDELRPGDFSHTGVFSRWDECVVAVTPTMEPIIRFGLRWEWWKYSQFVAGQAVFFTTDTGFLGIAPQSVQAGDEAVILRGSTFPVVLRHVHDHHKFRGLAWVNGVMDSEVPDVVPYAKMHQMQFQLA